MSIWTRQFPKRISGWWVGLPFALFFTAVVLYPVVVVGPRNIAHTRALQTLRPEEVKAVHLKGRYYMGDSPPKERQLDPEEIPRFLELISQARPVSTVGRRTGVWSCEVEIEVVNRPPFKFMINGSEGNENDDGVKFHLCSRHGTLRSDDLGSFAQAMVRGGRQDPVTRTN